VAETTPAAYSGVERDLIPFGLEFLKIVNLESRSGRRCPLSAERTVLLVEDEALVAALAVDALEELGYQTLEAATSKAALEICAGAAPLAFAVIDVGLPDGRGDALAVELRKLRVDLPVIIATGYDEAHLDERLRRHDRTAVLNKPYDITQLQAAISKIASSV
jgi:CheY-like chemotaxis protein